jgi:hypothetical protein
MASTSPPPGAGSMSYAARCARRTAPHRLARTHSSPGDEPCEAQTYDLAGDEAYEPKPCTRLLLANEIGAGRADGVGAFKVFVRPSHHLVPKCGVIDVVRSLSAVKGAHCKLACEGVAPMQAVLLVDAEPDHAADDACRARDIQECKDEGPRLC